MLAFAAANPGFDYSAYDNENPWGLNSANDYAFNEPDGYVDHLILVHAGADQSAGGGAQGDDSIWAHSWWIDATGGDGMPGLDIPGTDGQGLGGGSMHAYTYTINPEDGDIGVFCHEFGHDLGLPDEYDYTGPTGDASSGFWTLMSSGSWLGRQSGTGTKPAPMNVWDKSALGFVTPKTVKRGKTATVKLQPAAVGNANAVGVKIELPKRKHTIQLSGKDGATEWYSGFGNMLDNTLTDQGGGRGTGGERDADPPHLVRHRAGLRLRLRQRLFRRRRDLDVRPEHRHGRRRDGPLRTERHRYESMGRHDDLRPVGLRRRERARPVRVQDRPRASPRPAGRSPTSPSAACALPAAAFASDGWKRVDGATTQMSDQLLHRRVPHL